MEINEVLQKLNLSPVDKGNYFLINCPSCGRREMFIYKSSKKMICNRRNKCGAEYTLESYLKENSELIFDDIKTEVLEVKEEKLIIPEGLHFFIEPNKGFVKRQALQYLVNRGIQKKYIRKIGYIFEPNTLYNKTIFIPFYENSNLVYYTCRDFTDNRFIIKDDGKKEKLRYIAAKGVNSHKYLFNYDEITEDQDLFIFEGLMCAMSLKYQIGTATLTSTLGDIQASKIWDKSPKSIILVPDNDEAGRNNLMKNYRKLLTHRPPSLINTKILYYNIINYKDFNESGDNEIDLNKCEEIKKEPFSRLLRNYL